MEKVFIKGFCPACGSASLFLGSGNYLTCAVIGCPNPSAVSDLLEDRETKHIVTFTDRDFTLRHPLIERLGDALTDCDVHKRLAALDGPPAKPGKYRVRVVGDRMHWEPVS